MLVTALAWLQRRLHRISFLSGCLAAFAVISMLALCGTALWNARSAAQRTSDQIAVNIVRTLELEIARNFELFDLSLQGAVIASKEPASSELNGTTRHIFIFDNAVKARFLSSIILLDETGKIVEDSKSLKPRPGNFADRDYFHVHTTAADEGLFLSKPFQSRLSNDQWVIAISRRINKPNGLFGGVAVGVVQLDYFNSILQHLSLGRAGTVAVFHRNGSLISHMSPDQRDSADIRESLLPRFNQRASFGVYEEVASANAVPRRYTFGDVPGLPIVIVVGLALSDVYGGWRSELLQIVALTVVMLGAIALLGLMLLREFRARRSSDEMVRESEARYRVLAEHSSDAIILRNAQAERTYTSPAFYAMVGRSAEELQGHSIREHLDEAGQESTRRAFERLEAGESPVVTGFEYRRPDGSVMWLEAISNGIFDASGRLKEIVTNLRDATARKQLEDRLAAVATTDALTQLGNRRAFEQRIKLEWDRAVRKRSDLCVLMIDVDHFKRYNDRFGHIAGDVALRAVADALSSSLHRPADFSARYGGEEFVAILPETDLAGGGVVAEAIRTSVTMQSLHSRMTVSVGIAVVRPQIGGSWLDLVAHADAALYEAKRVGRDRCVPWSSHHTALSA